MDEKCGYKTPTSADSLEQQIIDPSFPKNEREWWASAEITRLRAEVDLVIAQREAWCVSAIACQRSSAKFAAEADRLRAELENVRLLASRHRTEEWAGHMLRFCAEAGVKPSPFRGALQGDKP